MKEVKMGRRRVGVRFQKRRGKEDYQARKARSLKVNTDRSKVMVVGKVGCLYQ